VPPRPGRRRLLAFASDLGDAYAAQVKGVLARSIDPGWTVDLTHDLPAHGIAEAAFVVRAIGVRFPAGTVYLIVVDPGVGGSRAPVVLACRDGSLLVGPDNGVLYPLSVALGGATGYRIDPARLGGGSRVGTTFDGRDLFAPAAVRLFLGTPPSRLGPRIDPVRYELPVPERTRSSAQGEVVHADRFGNLITNIPSEWVPRGLDSVELTFQRGRPHRLPFATSYAAIGQGRLGALGSSFGTVEVAVGEGRASAQLRVGVGARVVVRWGPPHRRASRTVNSARPRRG